jgi:hypothetical protein
MDEKQLETLRTQDWDEVAAKVLNAARVFGAICEIWENPGRLNPSYSVTAQLKGIVKSKLWNLSQSADERVARTELHEVAVSSDDWMEKADDRDEFDRAVELLGAHPKVKSKAELELVVAAISCGAMDADAIAKETELSRERVYQLLRELRAIYPDIARQLRDGGSAS